MDAATQDMLKNLFETKLNSAMRLYLETCTHCGACVEACVITSYSIHYTKLYDARSDRSHEATHTTG